MTNTVKVKWWHIALVIVGLGIITSLFDSPDPAPTAAGSTTPEAQKPKPLTQEEAYAKEVAALYRSLKAGEVGLKGTETDRATADFAQQLYYWQDAASIVSKRDGHPGQDSAKLVVAEFKKLFPKLYPAIRKQYAEAIGQRLWRENWEVEHSGKKITFINAAFSNNAAIEEAHKRIKFDLELMRFTRADYKWIPSDPRWTYFDIESRPDTQVGP